MPKEQVVIIGGGWAGLSSAIRLKEKAIPVKLFEASRQLGGRARCIKYKNLILDNGQHILLGSCTEVLSLFKLLEIQESHYLKRQTLNLDLLSTDKINKLHIHPANTIAPLHLFLGFLYAKGLTIKEKQILIVFFIQLKLKHYQLSKDESLLSYLQKNKQSSQLIHVLWEPLCLAIMNTPIKTASAQIFFNVLRLSFNEKIKINSSKKNSDLLLFSTPLCDTLAAHSKIYLGKAIHTQAKVDSLIVRNNHIVGFRYQNKSINCSQLILATPMHIALTLLSPFQQCKELISSLKKIDYQPIYTVYLCYKNQFILPQNMTGILKAYSQWVFDKQATQEGLLAIIISGPGKHQEISRDKLIAEVNLELQSLFTLPELDWGIVVTENKATINCSVNNNQYRPNNHTPIQGLYLAGDYTNTGYPSTLEGAVISGKKAAGLAMR